ncbi:hypothetical protein M422DRAFT_273768 [Sphaerobolus stellatus SS14]|uniref:Unplaced genomic scaffold SPHSTscaffold_348, whole genome shotgun sequence n=1 Tax=Sphaerobolus stellatus (strain SS14) TaxID=990650 RepID=A0A0C9UIP7_SPHS4|nr:hypothetical protein M422DRAFT_273768 [Sphaerobolus stellatus SS14]
MTNICMHLHAHLWRMDSKLPCAFPIASDVIDNFPTITLKITQTTPLWFYCPQTNPANHCHLGMVGSINALTTGNKTFADFQAAAMGTTANSTTAAGNTTVPAGGVASAASNGAFKAASSGLTVALALVAGQSSFYEFSHELIGVILFIYILPFEIRYQACRFEFGLGRPTGLESSWGSPSANLTHCI